MRRKTFVVPLVLALAGLGRADAGVAQESGLGAFLDWIHKMSGPGFVGVGGSYWIERQGEPLARADPGHREPGIRLRLSLIHRVSYNENDTTRADEPRINMSTAQATVEFPLPRIPFEFGVGFAVHYFSGGDLDDNVVHVSVPVLGQYRIRRADWNFVPRIGLAVNVFPAFDPVDFQPLQVPFPRRGAEAVLNFFFAVDFR